MKRVRLVCWNPAEAMEKGESVRSLGYDVDSSQLTPETLKALRVDPPSAIVIDLDRLPAQGRDIGVVLRKHKTTRHVPIVFAGGKREKVTGVKGVLPDAKYTDWSRIQKSLEQAIANPPSNPVVHDSVFAGYSKTPLPKKLGIKANSIICLVGAPSDFEITLGSLPDKVTFRRRATDKCDLMIWFTKTMRDLERRINRLGDMAGSDGLWIAWPKKASGIKTDLTQAVVRQTGLDAGLVDYKVCSVDETWTGLRFTKRKKTK